MATVATPPPQIVGDLGERLVCKAVHDQSRIAVKPVALKEGLVGVAGAAPGAFDPA